MARKADIQAGRAFVELFIKNDAFFQGLDAVRTRLGAVRQTLHQFAQGVQRIAGAIQKISAGMLHLGASITAPFILALTRLDAAKPLIEEIQRALTYALAPAILPILKLVRDWVLVFAEWAKQNPGIIRGIFLMGLATTAVGIALFFAAQAFAVLAGAVTIASAAVAAFEVIASPIGVIVLAISAAIAALTLYFVAVTAAIALAVFAFIKYTKAGQALWDQLGKLVVRLREFFGLIANAAFMGKFELAWNMAVMGMTIAFDNFVINVLEGFIKISKMMQKIMMYTGQLLPALQVALLNKELDVLLKGMENQRNADKSMLGALQKDARNLPRANLPASQSRLITSPIAIQRGAAAALGTTPTVAELKKANEYLKAILAEEKGRKPPAFR